MSGFELRKNMKNFLAGTGLASDDDLMSAVEDLLDNQEKDFNDFKAPALLQNGVK